MPDASHVTAGDGGALPHRLGDRETKTFAGRLLQDNRGRPLQRIHQDRIIDGENDDPDIFIAPRLPKLSRTLDFLQQLDFSRADSRLGIEVDANAKRREWSNPGLL